MLNIITFAATLSNNLTIKVLDKFENSKENFFSNISNKYRKEIYLLETDSKQLIRSSAPKFKDGTLKPVDNLWDLLDIEDKGEALSLIDLDIKYQKDIRKLRLFFLTLATKAKTINDFTELQYNEVKSYLKFLGCLPDVIRNDIELLTKSHTAIESISIKDLEYINSYISSLETSIKVQLQDEITDFIKKNSDDEINHLLHSFFALDFLMDF